MSRTYGHIHNNQIKAAVKRGCRTFSRVDARAKIHKILSGKIDLDSVTFNRFQDYDDRWIYD